MVLAILMASHKLQHYFQAHWVTVVTSYPLGHILRNGEGTGRTVIWAVELAEFGCQFAPRHAIKSQALTDFITEWTSVPDIEQPKETAYPAAGEDKPWAMEYWCMSFDGSLTL